MVAGETARLRSLLDGAESLRKADVLATLAEHDLTDAYRVYHAYVSGASDDVAPDFLSQFVDEQTTAMRAEV